VFDFSFDLLTNQYTFWSGIIGGTFLMLSYFGTDQSQVQRYLTAKSVDEARSSLLMSAYWKIPLQALILLIGVLVFLFYLFQPAPLLYNPRHDAKVQQDAPAEYAALQSRYASVPSPSGRAPRGPPRPRSIVAMRQPPRWRCNRSSQRS
jgi:SSS family solute:Na+ symporter